MDNHQLQRALQVALDAKSAGMQVDMSYLVMLVKADQRVRLANHLHQFAMAAWHVLEPTTEYIDGHHIRIICDLLERLADGQIDSTVLINIPPGSMKSLLCSVLFPCWIWTTRPDTRWLFASYAAERSTHDSRRRRTLLRSEWYQELWGDRWEFVGDQNRQTRYENNANGWMFSTSVGGAATGEHPDFVIADDPHNVKEAESNEERQHAVDWWRETISSRGVIRNVKRIVIMQRLHENDLSGDLISKGDIEHVCFPMRYEDDHPYKTDYDWRTNDGELLWPGAFDEEKVRSLETDMGSYTSAGQLQQRPAPRGGGMFKREWFDVVEAAPAEASRVRGWDKAATEAGGAYTAGVLVSKTRSGVYYIEHVIREHTSPAARYKLLKQIAEMDAAKYGYGTVEQSIEEEGGSAGKDAAWIERNMLAGHSVHCERPTGSKETRALPFAAQCEAGNVRIVKGDWNAAWLDEVCVFPNGKYKDQTDATSNAFMRLATNERGYNFGPIIASGEDPEEERRPFSDEELEQLDPYLRDLVESSRESARSGRMFHRPDFDSYED